MSVGIPLAVLAQSLASCGSDGEDQACAPNSIKACALAGQSCNAVQACKDDGSGYEDCACPGTGAAGSAGASSGGGSGGRGSGSGGAAGAAGAGTGGPLFEVTDRAIGAPCNADSDCLGADLSPPPLRCITAQDTATFGAGGPQGGYCTADCASNADCAALDGLSACAQAGFCISLCQPGADDGLVKCAVDDFRAQSCTIVDPDNADTGACLPICTSDAGCGAGLFCDLGRSGLGLCTTTAPTGGDIGAPCSVDTAETDCKSGICLQFGDAADGGTPLSFCSANCTNGLLAGCGFEEQISTPREAACAQAQALDGGFGDIGFCFELCDEDADCAQAGNGWICSEELSEEGQTLTGRAGLCLPPEAVGTADAG